MSKEKIIDHQRNLLTILRGHLNALYVPNFLTADHNGQPCLEITNHNARTRPRLPLGRPARRAHLHHPPADGRRGHRRGGAARLA
ncbi:hypothetical protein [Streptosporangium saharense]|uniref:Uncharacterized protein n=1 Tax=Streptosporangium saharense TaxID=1706840 RepID=A0A7W7QSX4_9ACTN|nr:hypothetical protein [Streptosporangium saharense]MBB4919113.1 hypothetical protein [Streptosporangium saharense]